MDLNFNLSTLISLTLGILLSIFGRRIFWLLIGAGGFIAGIIIFDRFFPEQTGGLPLITALLIGLAGAGLAVFLQKTAVWVIGFFAGSFITLTLFSLFGLDLGNMAWLFIVFGGAVGAALTILLFEWALVILSSLAGSVIIVNAVRVEQPLTTGLLVAIFVFGLIIQLRRRKK
jgi:hypothetical protein